MKLFVFKIEWNQAIREQIYQDESRYRGTQRVVSPFRVLADTEQLAFDAANAAFKHESANITLETSIDVHCQVTYERKTITTVSNAEITKLHSNNDDPYKGKD